MFFRLELTIGNSALVEHTDGGFGFDAEAGMVEIVGVDDFFNAGLDDGFGTVNAREIMDVDAGALQFAHIAAEIKDGVELSVADVGVFRIIMVALAVPGEIIVAEAVGCAVVADGEYAIIRAGDASADLGIGILAAH